MDNREALQKMLQDRHLWRSSQEVGQLLDPATSDPECEAGQARRLKQVFAAWEGDRFHYPAFQFQSDGRVRPQVPALVAALPDDRDGRINIDAALWVHAPTAALDDRTPAAVFATDPEAVIALAQRLRDGSADSD